MEGLQLLVQELKSSHFYSNIINATRKSRFADFLINNLRPECRSVACFPFLSLFASRVYRTHLCAPRYWLPRELSTSIFFPVNLQGRRGRFTRYARRFGNPSSRRPSLMPGSTEFIAEVPGRKSGLSYFGWMFMGFIPHSSHPQLFISLFIFASRKRKRI